MSFGVPVPGLIKVLYSIDSPEVPDDLPSLLNALGRSAAFDEEVQDGSSDASEPADVASQRDGDGVSCVEAQLQRLVLALSDAFSIACLQTADDTSMGMQGRRQQDCPHVFVLRCHSVVLDLGYPVEGSSRPRGAAPGGIVVHEPVVGHRRGRGFVVGGSSLREKSKRRSQSCPAKPSD